MSVALFPPPVDNLLSAEFQAFAPHKGCLFGRPGVLTEFERPAFYTPSLLPLEGSPPLPRPPPSTPPEGLALHRLPPPAGGDPELRRQLELARREIDALKRQLQQEQ